MLPLNHPLNSGFLDQLHNMVTPPPQLKVLAAPRGRNSRGYHGMAGGEVVEVVQAFVLEPGQIHIALVKGVIGREAFNLPKVKNRDFQLVGRGIRIGLNSEGHGQAP